VITEAILGLLAWVIEGVAGALSPGTLGLPSASGISASVGEYAGPIDNWLPLSEAAFAIAFVVTVWLPVAATYSLVMWVYTHIPVLGAGQ
jgi:hypothetical protein